MSTSETLPSFQSPNTASSPTVNSLLNENFVLEQEGVDFHTYRILTPSRFRIGPQIVPYCLTLSQINPKCPRSLFPPPPHPSPVLS